MDSKANVLIYPNVFHHLIPSIHSPNCLSYVVITEMLESITAFEAQGRDLQHLLFKAASHPSTYQAKPCLASEIGGSYCCMEINRETFWWFTGL